MPRVRAALELAASRIRAFHERQHEPDVDVTLDGVRLELRVTPLARVGLYVPGGTARYPSSVLMTAIPAKVAGVAEVIMVTPGASPEAMLAARLAGVDRVFELGGAQAIGALAYGTQTVPRVDKIVGPGNAWVASAKRQVYGEVDIDSIAGPSEVLIIADDDAPAAWVAADLLAQAEHDREARAILVTTSTALAAAVARRGRGAARDAAAPAIAEHAISHHGAAVIVDSIDAGDRVRERYAPEHLELDVADARARRGALHDRRRDLRRRAGRRRRRATTSRARNHVLPTGGAARYASPLGVHDFRKRTSLIEYTREAAIAHADEIAVLAACEGLDAHGRSALRRKEKAVSDADDLGPLAQRVPEALRGTAAYHVPQPPHRAREARRERAAVRAAGRAARAARRGARRGRARALSRSERARAARARREQLGVAGDQLVFGNGSDETIAMLVAAFAAPRVAREHGTVGSRPAAILYPMPSFVYYRLAAIARGVEPIEVPLDRAVRARRGRDRARDRDAPAERRVPRAAEQSDRHAVAHGLRGRARGAAPRRRGRLRRGVLRVQRHDEPARTSRRTRTWSSCARCRRSAWRACASATRCRRPAIAQLLEKVRPPYNVSSLDQRAAVFLARAKRTTGARRARPRSWPSAPARRRRSLRCPASRCSRARRTSCSSRFGAGRATEIWQALADRGMLVRNFDTPGPLAGCLRITVGTPEENRGSSTRSASSPDQ